MPRTIIVTGGAGFIGSAVVRQVIAETDDTVVNLDKLTYAANLSSLDPVADSDRYHFRQGDICDGPLVRSLFEEFTPDAIVHLAAESHVDRSIDDPATFITTNVNGTATLLEAALDYFSRRKADKPHFRFLHISTDEVFGSLGADGFFNETTAYSPRSPYSASKAASDHLVRAWHDTFGLPTLITNCSNNYGPYQFPEKLIPLMILKGLAGEPLPIYGKGENVRDWLFVDDHAAALRLVLDRGRIGQTYLIGGRSERTNLTVVEAVCDILDSVADPLLGGKPRRSLMQFVTDRPGHDFRYAIDPSLIERELGWESTHNFESGLKATIEWYLANESWWKPILESRYAGGRLGVR